MDHSLPVTGWDIGGVNTKAVRALRAPDGGITLRALARPFEIQHEGDRLEALIAAMAAELGADAADRHAITMTAELSRRFRTKREGVAFVLDALERALGRERLWVYTVGEQFVRPDTARREPLAVAASNWVATAALAGRWVGDGLLIDVGTTTTDIIPIVGGRVAAVGRDDPGRLLSGELVYTGALRTPVEAICRTVPLANGHAGVSAEGFALVGDAHLWRGRLRVEDYSVRPPDGRPASRESAGERLARVVCADREQLDDGAIDRIAAAIAAAQIDQIRAGIARVRGRVPTLGRAIVTGLGAWLAAEAADAEGLDVLHLAERLGPDAARTAPAAAVALLLGSGTQSAAA